MEPIRVANFQNFLTYLPLYVAEAFGYFSRQGIKLELKRTGSDLAAIQALLSGDCQFAITDPTFILQLEGYEDKIRILSPLINKVALFAMYRDSKLFIETDRKIPLSVKTLSRQSTAYRMCDKWLAKLGFAEDQYHIESVEPSNDNYVEYITSIIDGAKDVDCIVLSEPETTWIKITEPHGLSYRHRRYLHETIYGSNCYAFTAVLVRRDARNFAEKFIVPIKQAASLISYLPPYSARKSNSETGEMWKKILVTVRPHISQCYPPQLNETLNDDEIAGIIENMKKSTFFSKSILYNRDSDEFTGLIYAFENEFSNIDQKRIIVDNLYSI